MTEDALQAIRERLETFKKFYDSLDAMESAPWLAIFGCVQDAVALLAALEAQAPRIAQLEAALQQKTEEAEEWRERAYEWSAERDALRAVMVALLDKMDMVIKSPEYLSALAVGWVHSQGEYRGPDWAAEYAVARAACLPPEATEKHLV